MNHAPGSASAQVALLSTHARYVRAEQLCEWFPEISELGLEADQRHQQMFQAALLCGFEPGWAHGHLTCLQWVERRVRVLQNTMPAHVAEARRTA